MRPNAPLAAEDVVVHAVFVEAGAGPGRGHLQRHTLVLCGLSRFEIIAKLT
jgi:hypothetical protein